MAVKTIKWTEYVITYAATRGYALDIETISFADESDARVAMARLRAMPRTGFKRIISATLADPRDRVIDEFEADGGSI